MFPPDYFLFAPMTRADDAFPRVFIDREFSYGSSATIETKIDALKDLEYAFRLLNTCIYEVPENYTNGLKKIVECVGERLNSDGGNATSLRKRLEREVYPERKSCIGVFLQGMRSAFGRKSKHQDVIGYPNAEGRQTSGQPDPHAYAKLRMRFPDIGI